MVSGLLIMMMSGRVSWILMEIGYVKELYLFSHSIFWANGEIKKVLLRGQ